MLSKKIMAKELKQIFKYPIWWWLTIALLIFITVSPFLVTVTQIRYLSIIRELIVIALIFLGLKERKQKGLPFIQDDIERLMFWLVIIGILSTIFITQDAGAFLWSARYSLLPLGVFWSLHSMQPTKEQITHLLTIWIFWAAAIVIWGLIIVEVIPKETLIGWGYNPEVAVGDGQWQAAATLPAWQTVAGSIPRLQSTMSGPIQFAGFSLLIVFLTPLLKRTRCKYWYPVIILLGIIGIIGSFSRAAWFALLIVCAYFIFQNLGKSGWKKSEISALFFTIIFVISALGAIVLFQPNAERSRQLIANIFNRSVSDRQHVNSISQSVDDFSDIGIFGLGFGRSGAASIQNNNFNPDAPEPRFVDNSYLRWYEELGFLGAIIFINILILLSQELYRQSAQSRRLAYALGAISITAIFTDMWLEAVPVITIFAIAGLIHKSVEPKEQKNNIKLAKYNLTPLTFSNFINKIFQLSKNKKANHVITLNPEMMVESYKNKNLRETMTNADYITADGVGILAAASYQHYNKYKSKFTYWLFSPFIWLYTAYQLLFTPDKLNPHLFRITGSDLVNSILERGNEENIRLAILGSTDQVIKEAKSRIERNYPNIRLVFADNGPKTVQSDGSIAEHEMRRLASVIQHCQPNILLLAFGVPKQELFINRYKNILKVPVMIGVSGAFDMVLANRIKRAPKIFRIMQLEWLWRLIKQPSRIKRIYTAVIKFPLLHTKDSV